MEPILDPTAPVLHEGDIVEVTINDRRATAEVMLLSDGLVLLDLFDGERPALARLHDLRDVAVFRPEPELIAA